MYDVVNEQRLGQELGRIFKGVSKDPRIERWIKKKARAFLKSCPSDVIEIQAGSPLARGVPDWAAKKVAEGEPVYTFALSHSSEDQLSHIRDVFETLIDEEQNQEGVRRDSAERILESLSHYDVRGAYEMADEYFATMSRHNVRHSGRSRNAVFAAARDDEEPVSIETDSGLVWRQVVPRGLKTVGVVLQNCIGGRSYANSVKNGHSEVWCLTEDVSDEEFEAQRDILMVAQIDLKSETIREAKGPGNRIMPQYASEIEEFADAKGVTPARGTTGNRTVLHRDSVEIANRKLAVVGEYELYIEKAPSEKVPYAIDADKLDSWALKVARVTENGRLSMEYAGALWKNHETRNQALDLSQMCLLNDENGLQYDKIAAVVEGLKEVVTHQLVAVVGGAAMRTPARDAVRKPPEDLPVDAVGELVISKEGDIRNFMDRVVYEDGDENVELSVTEDGIVIVRDLLEEDPSAQTHVLSGASRVTTAADTLIPSKPASRSFWRRLMTADTDVEPTAHRALGSRKPMHLAAFNSLQKLDPSGDMTRTTMQLGPLDPVSFAIRSEDQEAFRGQISRKAAAIYIEEAEAHMLVTEVGEEGRLVQMELNDGSICELASIRSRNNTESFSDYGFEMFREKSVIAGMQRKQNGFQRASASIPLLRELGRMCVPAMHAPYNDATGGDQHTNNWFPKNLIRDGKLVPDTLKNLGTDETPIIRLDNPKRFVGLEVGADGSLDGGRIAWVAGTRPRGEITLHNVIPGGSAHLARALEDRTWRISGKMGYRVEDVLKEDGFRVANGMLLEIGHASVDDIERDDYKVTRNPSFSGDDRQWSLHHKNMLNFGTISAVGMSEPKIDGKTRADIFYLRDQPVDEASRQFILDVINTADLAFDQMDMHLLAVAKDTNGDYVAREGSSLDDAYDVSDTHYVGRIIPSLEDYPGETNGQYVLACWSIVNKDTNEVEALMSRDGFHAQVSSLDLLTSAAELKRRIEADTLHEAVYYRAADHAAQCV